MNKEIKFTVFAVMAVTLIFLAGCGNETNTDSSVIDTDPIGFQPNTNVNRAKASTTLLTTELKDLNSGATYTLNDFKGKPILLESFAVWCPTCTRQQNVIKDLHEELDDSAISISLDTDPNEDESKILEHTKRNNFDWRYSISPPDFTKALMDEFGVGIISAPQAPVVLICPDQTVEMLKRGVKSPEFLKEKINSCG